MAGRICLAAVILLGASSIQADTVDNGRRAIAVPPGTVQVTVSDGLVTVRAHGVSLADVLGKLARVTGLTLASGFLPDARVIVDVQRLPLADALHRILGGRSYLLYQANVGSDAVSRDGTRGMSVLWVYPDGSGTAVLERTSSTPVDPMFLQSRLLEGEFRERLEAIKAARRVSADDALEPLSLALTDTDAKVRVKAIYGLVEMGGSGAVNALASALGDENPGVREEAVYALGTIGGAEVPGLLEYALDDPDPGVRESAIKALVESGGPESVGVLTATLGDVDADTRRAAVDALADIASPAAVVAIETALGDDADSVRQAARDALTDLSMSPTKPGEPGMGEDH